MKIRGICILLVSGALGVSPFMASAQVLQPLGPVDYDHNMQPFAPVELDFNNMPTRAGDGFFFNYDKLHWAATGERAAIGDRNVVREANPVWYDNNPFALNPFTNNTQPDGGNAPFPNPFPVDQATGRPLNPDTGEPINRPLLQTSLMSSVPRAVFGWGDRYEFGYWEEDTGWMMTILDWEQTQSEAFGIGLDPDSILGDVYVGFNYEPGFMHGFLDVIEPPGNGRVLNGDGFADDIDRDGQFGPDGLDLQDPADVPESFPAGGGLIPDYDDLVELPTSFQSLVVINRVEVLGIELMKMHRLNNRHFLKTNQNNFFTLSYGARFLQFSDNLIMQAGGGVLGLTEIDTKIDNNIVGPAVGLRWENLHGHWTTDVDGRFTFGYNISDWTQDGFVGADNIPGRLNHPLYAQPHTFSYGRQAEDFSPIVELRLGVKYRVSQSFLLKLGYSSLFINNIRRASTHVDYSLPNVGFIDGRTEHVIINGVNAGVEFRH